MSMAKRFLALLLLVVWVTSAYAIDVQPQPLAYRTIALSTDPAPQQADGVTFGDGVSAGVINDRGDIAFQVSLAGPGIGRFGFAEYFQSGGSVEKVYRVGDPVPGVTGATWTFPRASIPVLSESGRFLLHGVIDGAGFQQHEGLWLGEQGDLQLLFRQGDPLPTGQDLFGAPAQGAAINRHGQVAFFALHTDNTGLLRTGGAIWLAEDTGFTPIAQLSQNAPGTDGVFEPNFRAPRLSDTGQVLFSANISGPNVEFFNNHGIWYGNETDGLQLIARSNDVLTIENRRIQFSTSERFSRYQLSQNGEIAFSAETIITDTITNEIVGGESILAGRPGEFRVVATTDQPAAGTPDGVAFENVANLQPLINRRGDVAFFAELRGGSDVTADNEFGFWLERDNQIIKVARDGDPAPGLPDGVTFGRLLGEQLALNENGQVAFMARLEGGEFAGLTSLWATDLSNQLYLVAAESQPIELPDGTMKTISSGRTAGLGVIFARDAIAGSVKSGFNNSGELAFRLKFDDFTSGLFVASIPVPEPGSCTLSILALAGAITYRCRNSVI